MKKILLLITLITTCNNLYAQKPAGSYLQLDGDGDFMQLSDYADSLIFDGPATIEFWARANFDHKSQVGIIWHVGDNNPLLASGSEYFELTCGSHSGAINDERINIIYSLGVPDLSNFYYVQDDGYYQGYWEHYAIVADGGEYNVFINGQLQGIMENGTFGNSVPKYYGNAINPKINAALGSRYFQASSTYGFEGSIDEFRIWNVARTQEQIQNSMNDTLSADYYTSADSGLVGYWRFDLAEDLGVGSANLDIRDFSINGYHGDLAGNATVQWEAFTNVNFSLPTVISRSAAWGDYDNDDDLDLILENTFFENKQDSIVNSSSSLLNLSAGSSAWGDFDNDNDLDVIHSGFNFQYDPYAFIYSNNQAIFTNTMIPVPGVFQSSLAWGDYDNDGDLDLLITGSGSHSSISNIYRNDDSTFTDTEISLMGISEGSGSWGDYDKDGDLDILLTNYTTALIYRNDDSIFTTIQLGVNEPGPSAWGDYDSDGDLDILITSGTGFNSVLRNDDTSFTNINASIQAIGSAAWGDYDNDGDLDILIAGTVFSNDDGVFNNVVSAFATNNGLSAWGDYDNDGDLDILFWDGLATRIYRNNSVTPNTAPEAPVNLNSFPTASTVLLNWAVATDAQTPSPGLTYNLRIGTTSGGSEIMSPMAGNNGYRQVVQMGNVNHNLSWMIKNLQSNTNYYWSVQAIDNSFAGGHWADEQQFNTIATSIGEIQSNMPQQFGLIQNYPNPFNPLTTIEYHIAKASHVELKIFNSVGQLVQTLVRGQKSAGIYKVNWDATQFSSGIYYYVLTAGDFKEVRKSLLIK